MQVKRIETHPRQRRIVLKKHYSLTRPVNPQKKKKRKNVKDSPALKKDFFITALKKDALTDQAPSRSLKLIG